MKVTFSKHARAMLKERGLKRDFVAEVVRNSEWRERGGGNVWYAFKRVGKKVLRVVVADEGKTQVVETQYFDRRLK